MKRSKRTASDVQQAEHDEIKRSLGLAGTKKLAKFDANWFTMTPESRQAAMSVVTMEQRHVNRCLLFQMASAFAMVNTVVYHCQMSLVLRLRTLYELLGIHLSGQLESCYSDVTLLMRYVHDALQRKYVVAPVTKLSVTPSSPRLDEDVCQERKTSPSELQPMGMDAGVCCENSSLIRHIPGVSDNSLLARHFPGVFGKDGTCTRQRIAKPPNSIDGIDGVNGHLPPELVRLLARTCNEWMRNIEAPDALKIYIPREARRVTRKRSYAEKKQVLPPPVTTSPADATATEEPPTRPTKRARTSSAVDTVAAQSAPTLKRKLGELLIEGDPVGQATTLDAFFPKRPRLRRELVSLCDSKPNLKCC